jgi:hypothetical protein
MALVHDGLLHLRHFHHELMRPLFVEVFDTSGDLRDVLRAWLDMGATVVELLVASVFLVLCIQQSSHLRLG